MANAPAELGAAFNLDRALNQGLLPGIWFSDDPEEESLSSYVSLYLEQEILQEGATRNLPAFSRFLEVAALSSGGQVNYQSIASDADACRRDAEIAYWRTRTNLEVDFVVDGETAVEVENVRNVARDDLKGLRAIADEGTFRHRILVCNEPRVRIVDGIEIVPWRVFVDRLWSGGLF